MLLAATVVQAQITICGSVYGGGNAGDTGGSTKVTVCAGNLHAVFAGARMANVGGSAFVHIDGEHASDYILADYVYGGNDISGTIGTSDNVPTELTEVIRDEMTDEQKSGKNAINNTWNAFVRISTKTETVGGKEEEADDAQKIYIGQLFGGGNGYYKYETKTTGTGTIVKDALSNGEIVSSSTTLSEPELGKTYLEILGGSIVYAYGGGNNATVTDTTVICLDNPSKVVNSIRDTRITTENSGELLTDKRFELMRINTGFSYPSSDAFQIGRLFGGNNKAEMAIRPIWRLKRGKVRNLYSGGNEGAMTSKTGIHLVLNSADMKVDNVYGGCRMADVNPAKNTIVEETIEGTYFPAGYAARVLVTAGDINNVYGGNDVTGNVYGGNAVGIHSSIKGDVYGGGNGSYPYTDKVEYKNDDIYKDIYYEPGSNSLEALKKFRPNAEAVSIRVVGTDKDHPTIIGGAIYCGGNSATLHNDDPTKDAAAELKIGSYVIADKVFLGNNGANMVTTNEEEKNAAGEVTRKEGMLRTIKTVNSNDLTKTDKFEAYMDAVAMDIKPRVVFDDVGAYEPYSTKFGSFYCGGNVGSMKIDGAMEVSFNDKVIIYNKVVGGSNEANVYKTDYNAQYLGGLLGDPDANGNKVILNFGGLKIQPMRWIDPDDKSKGLEWNTVDGTTYNTTTKTYTPMPPVVPTEESATGEQSTDDDLKRRFQGGNIYGGCYNNGHVNGNVVINLNASLVDRKGENAIFDEIEEEEGEAKLYGKDNYKILKRNTGVILDEQGMDVLGRALNVFGGGYGGDSEIWGSTTINLNAGYTFQIFGGGEQGAIGNAVSHEPNADDPTIHDLTYEYDEKYSTYINVRGNYPGTFRGDNDEGSDGVKDHEDMAEAEFIYGGSFEGPIAGSTHINLGNGRIFNSFAGSCNADILGHTETYIGRQVKPTFADKMPANVNNDNAYINGFPWIRDHVYGGNDLGGRILNKKNFINRVSADLQNKVHNPKGLKDSDNNPTPEVTETSAYMEYIQGRVEYIFGGCYGVYDYTDPHFKNYTYTTGSTDKPEGTPLGAVRPGFIKPRMDNAFINFKPNNQSRNAVDKIFGAGQGYQGEHDKDLMQQRSYVLIDAPGNLSNFQNMEVFGAGSFGGLGMNLTKAQAKADLDKVSAVIDLLRGKIANVYGGSWNEGMTRRTVVNVPEGSTASVANLFGGAFGSDPLIPCDVYEAQVNYHSEDATVRGNIYGGNNHADRTLYGQVNISVPVWQNKADGYLATVYGAGYGEDSWSQYTEVNLMDGAQVYEVYGGGENGQVLNLETVNKWQEEDSGLDLTIGSDYTDYGLDGFPENDPDAYLVKTNGLGTKTNTNVNIGKGALVGYVTYKDDAQHPEGRQKVMYGGYAFGGGKGSQAIVSGTTYIGLHGGVVSKDLYGGGYGGSVLDERSAKNFTARTNAYIEGGTLRKVFGGGYEGHVGKHIGAEVEGKFVAVAGSIMDDIPGETNVVIGIRKDQIFPEDFIYAEGSDSLNYYKGVPAIQWNAYGAGEGGSVFGTSHLTMNNGYIGYDYKGIVSGVEVYQAKLNNETVAGTGGVGQLKDYGSVFGAGYDDKSSSDFTNIKIYGGVIRGSLYGGGEIATVGRGRTGILSGLDRDVQAIYLSGGTHIEMYNGHVMRHVFGGGKGYNLYGYGGSNELYTDGYVFGKTEVYIHGGEVGTADGLAEGYGNVFGGGDVGFVYSTGYFDQHTAAEKANVKGTTGSPNHWCYYGSYKCHSDYGPYKVGDVISNVAFNSMTDAEKAHWTTGTAGKYLTEDCKVVVAPYLQVKPGKSASYDNVTYGSYEYVPTDYLNTLPSSKTDKKWTNLYTGDRNLDGSINSEDPVERGVHIRNAVFAGGNVSSNNDKTYANATTVFGNTTATLYDVYHRDFITVGTEHTGGLYGGGNLSMVDGYRELNITNYGTDYYGLDQKITFDEYKKLSNRERAYFQLKYTCVTAYESEDGTEYDLDFQLTEEEYNELINKFPGEAVNWTQYGFCSIYAGRLLNTIQRADLCGVFGSRMVLQGAKDRVAGGDNTPYTINRVSELSLNKQHSVVAEETAGKEEHGNYFGIYSVVNYLGNLTSDVHFDDPYYKYDASHDTKEAVAGATYYSNKVNNLGHRSRNNGTAENQVALASGVFLELTTENSTQTKKDYGYVTGIIELDLINVKKDIEGGGYVYAKNEHRIPRRYPKKENVILSEYNKLSGNEACTYKQFRYSNSDTGWVEDGHAYTLGYQDVDHENHDFGNLVEYQTSGNFIHKKKPIVDDCYPNNGVYNDNDKSPAHYWYIKGTVYVYDQVISAYAGSASTYSKEVKIPLTITAGSNGRLKLLNVQPNYYAYFTDNNGERVKLGTPDANNKPIDKVTVNNEMDTYKINDVISWWDYNMLPDADKQYFVRETYVNVDTCTVDGVSYPEGKYVMQPSDSTTFKTTYISTNKLLDKKGNKVTKFYELFHPSNNISHDNGYVLTFDIDSPKDWDDWYSPIKSSDGNKISKEGYDALSDDNKDKYRVGPTYTLKSTETSALYGQRQYEVAEIIPKEVYDDYTTTVSKMSPKPTGQAVVEEAYVALNDVGNVQAGSAVPKSSVASGDTNYDEALVCINTIQLGEEDYIIAGDLVAKSKKEELAKKYKTYNNNQINLDDVDDAKALQYIEDHLTKAYYCKEAGLYGGQYFEKGTNYGALKAWCALTDDRGKFDYNYDALDVLVDPDYHGEGHTTTYYKSPYSDTKPVEYEAFYTGTETLNYKYKDGTDGTIESGGKLSRDLFEQIENEQSHYSRIEVAAGGQTVHIAKETFVDLGSPYAEGRVISDKDYRSLTQAGKAKVKDVEFDNPRTTDKLTVYYCYDAYNPITAIDPLVGTLGAEGSVISKSDFSTNLKNFQKDFVVQGSEPTETTTLYVSRESNAKDVTSEKVISVVYQYTYYEDDDEGDGVNMVNELHVVNIHLKLESGVPEVGTLSTPPTILPGTKLGLKAPTVNPGFYEIITNGWEMYTKEEDAENHRNGIPFTNNSTPFYWYQNQKAWVAFYSKTYLGKTYSNAVKLSVANYHDLDAIMKDKEHHLYVDHPDVMRNSKIYIDNRDCESDATKSKLDLLKDFFDLSTQTEVATIGATKDHALLNTHVKGGADLEFILNSNVSPKVYTNWTPIGSDESECFKGNLHGDGYTISGLNNSLFGKLCGNVYNLGVTGSFTSAGVADRGDGYVENCWVNTSGTPATGVKAVFNGGLDGSQMDGERKLLVNCYYPETKDYVTGLARKMSETEFYNGTVAYNLNGFYLNKRYYDKTQTSGTEYHYLKYENGTLSENMLTGYYPDSYAFYPLDTKKKSDYGPYGYVEERYVDGDFIFAGGKVPEANDNRMRVVSEGVVSYAPIWPDDYIFFGQELNYGWGESHQDEPAHISSTNRVYRAPAYFRSDALGVAHFNAEAVIPAKSKPKTVTDTDLKDAYPGMTAIDFAGHKEGTVATAYKQGYNDNLFYQPLLDDDGLSSIITNGQTPNLLVYAPAESVNKNTFDVLNGYFTYEPQYANHDESSYTDGFNYNRVAKADASKVVGHLVQGDLTATNDHLLVDKQEFYCPIAYTFDGNSRMWYQRTPDNYVDRQSGWETISLPFEAEVVTTDKKGELTHFYEGSSKGHEYWLREYNGKKEMSGDVFTAKFESLKKATETNEGEMTKTVNNTFLWDFFYKGLHNQQDDNSDEYQEYYNYQKDERKYSKYPRMKAGTPYLIGFPGETYYEFDLSGNFKALNTSSGKPDTITVSRQTLTFVSNEKVTVAVSDNEQGTAEDGYQFKTNYLRQSLTGSNWALTAKNNDGKSCFDKTPAEATNETPAVTVWPFRPYFTVAPTQAPKYAISRIAISSDSGIGIGDDDSKEKLGESVDIRCGKRKVIVTSNLQRTADVRIFNVSGLCIATFDIEPGKTVEHPIYHDGVYVVHVAGGRYRSKLAVR